MSKIFSTVTDSSLTTSNIRSISPPGSTRAAFLVDVQISSEQFCENGVTGMTLILISYVLFCPCSSKVKYYFIGVQLLAQLFLPSKRLS